MVIPPSTYTEENKTTIKNAALPSAGTRGVKLSWCHPSSDYPSTSKSSG
jgi:hypothetical protein